VWLSQKSNDVLIFCRKYWETGFTSAMSAAIEVASVIDIDPKFRKGLRNRKERRIQKIIHLSKFLKMNTV
jgi:hypothetical protein